MISVCVDLINFNDCFLSSQIPYLMEQRKKLTVKLASNLSGVVNKESISSPTKRNLFIF
jgi:hypothetical protein